MAFWDYFGFSLGKQQRTIDSGLSGDTPATISFVAPENYDGTHVIETGGLCLPFMTLVVRLLMKIH